MGRFTVYSRLSLLLLLLLLGVAILGACAPDPTDQLISPNMVMITAGEGVIPPPPTATPAPTLDSLSEDEIYAGLTDAQKTAILNGDVARGQELSLLNGCIGCHSMDEGAVVVGPSWYNLANNAIVRVPGESPAFYLHDSIVNPNGFVVTGFAANIMPQNYSTTLSEQDLGDLVAYLLSLRADQ